MNTRNTSDTRTRTSGIKRPRFDTQNAIWYPKHLQIYHCPGFRNNFGLLLPALAQHFNAGRAEVVLTSSFLTLLILGSGQLWDVFVNLFTIDGGTLFSYGIKQLPFVIMMLTLGPLVATLLTFFSHQKVFNVNPCLECLKSNYGIFSCWKKFIPTYLLASCRISKCEIFNKF